MIISRNFKVFLFFQTEICMNMTKLDYRDKMILAPMVKIGTLPFRLLALEYGADIVYTEEIIDKRILNAERIVNPVLETVDYIDKSDNSLVFRTCNKEKQKLGKCKIY